MIEACGKLAIPPKIGPLGPWREFVYLAYLDDSDTRQKEQKWQVLTAVVVEDQAFTSIEFLSSMVIENLMPNDKYEQFEEFHACELYGGYGVFEGMDQGKRHEAIRTLLHGIEMSSAVIAYGAVDLQALSRLVYASANPVDMAFRACASGVEKWLEDKGMKHLSECNFEAGQVLPNCLGLFIADDGDKKDKATLQSTYRSLRRRMRPPSFETGKFVYLHDDMYFGDSKFSVGIQLADLCGYIIAKHLQGDVAAEGFYNMIKEKIIHAQIEPSSARKE
jgi:hypothetical protein